MKKIKTGDTVMVIAGKWKGTKSTVLATKDDKVVVKGVNIVKKAVKGQGFAEKEHPIHLSNVMLYDESVSAPSRVGIKEEGGKKVRYYKKSGKVVK